MSRCHFAQDCHFKWWFGLTPGLDVSGSERLKGSCNFYAEHPECSELAWRALPHCREPGWAKDAPQEECGFFFIWGWSLFFGFLFATPYGAPDLFLALCSGIPFGGIKGLY